MSERLAHEGRVARGGRSGLAYRTYVRYDVGMDEEAATVGERVVACCWLPGFPLRVIAHGHADLTRPVALASDGEAHPVVLDCTDAARDQGVEPGMLVSRAMGCCGALEVLGCDVPRVEVAAERFVKRLEAHGAAVQPMEPGRAFFDAAPLTLLYGGLPKVFERLLTAFARRPLPEFDALSRRFGQLGTLFWQREQPVRLRMDAAAPASAAGHAFIDWLK